jgi:hypothetical protein
MEREEPQTSEEGDLEEFDYMDPLKRDPEDDSIPGLDPIIPPVPPEE